ncbi:MurR/RpiR family transcriptional regulator [Limibaculum sp. FT325]|uniref:MurR/RpiR family transcriptional regulator n=1 Tax=Thermohalobaculum sediminis TaxID=2939436 RepID=UPI0020BE9CF1|nr:MurR/RpiR family transcriptional regulator [Limibaculum sediminis]MCL5778407.1 MurR/RpiR family transcriptional regulator [Limibaculum sediminis]
MRRKPQSIEELLRSRLDDLTRAERQVAHALLDGYPVSGLGSITQVAGSAQVSGPTVMRLARKLGFEGFTEFQEALRREVAAKISDPIRKRESWTTGAPGSPLIARFAEAVESNLRQTIGQIEPAAFDAAAACLADTRRRVLITGGRITRSMADYLFNHLQVIRPDVSQLGAAPGIWPHYLLDVRPGDVVVVFDIRRYENALLRLAEMAHGRGAEIVLFTDQWGSPIGKIARHRFSAHIEAPSAWDSSVAILMIVEALIAAVQDLNWQQAKARMETLERIFDETRLFRKFV